MLIIEGPDNAGKTTLVEHLLALDPQLRVLHRDRYKPDAGETIATSYLRALLPSDGDRVRHAHGLADRLFASECIYGELFRKGCRMSPGEHLAVRNVLNGYWALVVHVDAPDDVITKSWAKREQLYDDPLVIARAYRDRIQDIFRTSHIMHYDWTAPDAKKQRENIVVLHQARQLMLHRALAWWSANPHGVGKLRYPHLLLIGESPSPRQVVPVPFAAGPAGDFLAETIEAVASGPLGPSVRSELYVTNALKGTEKDAALLREELLFLVGPHTVVITLGREAEKMYESLTDVFPAVGHMALPHPQFWRRFRYPRRDEYVTMFSRAAALALHKESD